jgi:hypothetical protein
MNNQLTVKQVQEKTDELRLELNQALNKFKDDVGAWPRVYITEVEGEAKGFWVDIVIDSSNV